MFEQHKQFDEIEARLKRREPVVWDAQSIKYAAPVPQINDILRLPTNSFLGTDTDGDRHHMDSLDAGMPLKVRFFRSTSVVLFKRIMVMHMNIA